MSRRRTRTAADDGSAPGAGYVAMVRLFAKDRTVLAEPGERCDRVPEPSLTSLAARGKIRLVTEAGQD